MLVSNRKGELIMSERNDESRDDRPGGLLMTVEEVAVLWFGAVGDHGSASSNCQKIRRLIPDKLPARRIGNRWYVSRAAAEEWAASADEALVMAHPDTREAFLRRQGEVA
jgi:hypothetical protein